jgi:hypothetical protein
MLALDIEKLIDETNKQIKHTQKIHPDDPILISVILHNQILEAQIDILQKKMDETINRFTVISDQQVENAKAITENMTFNGVDNIEKQLDNAAMRWEDRLRKAAEETEANIRRASRLAWIGAALITITACVYTGTWLGNTIIDITNQQKSAQKQVAQQNNSRRK